MNNNSNQENRSGVEAMGQTQSGWIDEPVEGYAHIHSDGTDVSLLFDSREDYIYGMNVLAVTAFQCDLTILVMQVIGTHFHIIARGRPQDCDRFARSIAMKLESFLSRTKKRNVVKGKIRVSNDPIFTKNELKTKFMYVYRNAIVAGFPLAPWAYEWGPGDIYFVDHNLWIGRGKRVGEYPVLTRRSMFHTFTALPSEWRCDEEGKLLPHSYVDWKSVEALFRSPRAFLAFMSQKKDVEVAIDRECSSNLTVHRASETELRREAKALCDSLFGLPSLTKACVEQRVAIARKLWGDRRTYSLSVLSRVTMLDKNILESIFGKSH